MAAREPNAARLLVDRLVDAWGVRHIFGLPGDAITGLQAAIRERPELTFVQVRHEEAAAFAAVGYAKLGDRLGVCLATSGPGAIHLLNGLYDAKLDRVPVLAITGTQAHDLLGTFYQQDVDTDTLMADVAVHSVSITGPAQVVAALDAAVRLALAAPGVGHVSIASDIQQLAVSADKPSHMNQPGHTSTAWSRPTVLPAQEDLERATRILAEGSGSPSWRGPVRAARPASSRRSRTDWGRRSPRRSWARMSCRTTACSRRAA